MKKKQFRLSLLFVVVLAVSISQVRATDGYFSLGYGTQNKGLAGAGVAHYETSLINGNPAGLAFLENSYHVGVALFNPNRQFTITGTPDPDPNLFGLAPGTVESESKYFIIPSLGANWMVSDNTAFGVALFGNGGMNTDYPAVVFGDVSSTSVGVNLMQMFGNFSLSHKIGDNHSFGVTAIIAYQLFKAEGIATFAGMSSDGTKLSGNESDNSFGAGFKLGYMGKLADWLTVGATFQSKMYMSEFDDYAGLFAEQGDFDIPASWTAGVAVDASDDLKVLFDVKQILYSKVKAINNPMAMPAPLGADNGPGFGWQDMTVYKLGFSYTGIDTWTWRAGFSYGKNPIPISQVLFNILAPGVVESHLALGFSKALGDSGKQLHLSLNYALNNSVKGNHPFQNQGIELEMNQLELELGFSF